MEITNFPGVIGLIDCTHVEIIRPQIEEHNYFNRKGYHSKNIQLICDFDFNILNINSRFGGAAHDLYIWRQSQARIELEANNQRGDRNTWLLGDSGYPLEPWLMTPVINAAAGSPEFKYTERHIRTSNIVERCIGIYKARFLCLSKVLRYTPEKVGNIANACAILHNMCMAAHLNIDFNVQLHYDNIQEPPAAPLQVNVNRDGIATRQNVIQRYFN